MTQESRFYSRWGRDIYSQQYPATYRWRCSTMHS